MNDETVVDFGDYSDCSDSEEAQIEYPIKQFVESNFKGLYRHINVTLVTKSNGQISKSVKGDHNDWSIDQIKHDNGNKSSNTFSIYLKHSNCVVIDVDEPDFDFEKLPKKIKELPYTKGNTKGRHYYCRLKEDKNKINWFGTETKCFKDFDGDLIGIKLQKYLENGDIDISNKGGNNIWELKSKTVFNYFDEIPTLSFNKDIKPLLKPNAGIREVKKEKEIKEVKIKKEIDIKAKIDDVKVKEVKTLTDEEKEKIKKYLDCLDSDKYNNYNEWFTVCCALKNEYGESGFELFDYFSKKSPKYDYNEVYNKYYKDIHINSNAITMKTIYDMAKKDNRREYFKIMSSDIKTFEITLHSLSQLLAKLASDRFFYRIEVNDDKVSHSLWCNTKNKWVQSSIPLEKYITEDFFDYVVSILRNIYYDTTNTEHVKKFKKNYTKLSNIIRNKGIYDLINYYKKDSEKTIDFDINEYHFAFDNVIYDLEKGEFIEHKTEYFTSMTCGYDWREPTDEELKKMNEIINQIMPKEEERNLLLQIMSTGLYGGCIEKFFIFNAGGRNGKSLINDLLLHSLGRYGLTGNTAVLCEAIKSGANEERRSFHKKRYIVFREPNKSTKLNNGTVKDLTGGSTINARGIYKSETQTRNCGTWVLECNAKPLFANDLEIGEKDRIIDLKFPSRFINNDHESHLIDPSKFIFEADSTLKNKAFKDTHKFALLKILFEAFKKLKQNNLKFVIPKSVLDDTNKYIDSNSDICMFFEENYEKIILKDSNGELLSNKYQHRTLVVDVINKYKCTEYYRNLSKKEVKELITGKILIKSLKDKYGDDIKTNILGSEKFKRANNAFLYWKEKDIEEDEDNEDYDEDDD